MFESNNICKLLDIKYPILQGGMAWASDSKLACAVSDAGGLGIIGCGGRTLDWVLHEIDNAKKITSQVIGLNFPLEGMDDKEAEHIIERASGSGKNCPRSQVPAHCSQLSAPSQLSPSSKSFVPCARS